MECARQRLIRAIMLWRAIGQRANAGRTPAVYQFALVVVFASLLALAPTPRATAFGEEPPTRAIDPPVSAHVEDPPAEPTSEQIQAWIKELGDDDFQTRELAQRALIENGNAAFRVLDDSPRSDDPEIARRVSSIKKALKARAMEHFKALGGYLVQSKSTEFNMLTLTNCEIDDNAFEPIATLKQLEDVKASGTNISDAALVHLRSLPRLKRLNLSNTQVTDDGLREIAAFQRLTNLDLADCAVSDDGVSRISRLKELVSVRLSRTRITNKSTKTLGTLPHLRGIYLEGTRIGGEGLSEFRNLREQITVLFLSGTDLTDDDLAQLQGFTSLRSLRLRDTRIAGSGFEYISRLPNLTWLYFSGSAVTDEHLHELVHLPALTYLELKNTGVTVQGVRTLAGAPKLKTVCVPKSFTEDDIAELRFELGRAAGHPVEVKK